MAEAHCSRRAARASLAISARSAAKDFTTRVPFTFSSTTEATSALRPWMIHDSGRNLFRKRFPTSVPIGSVASATNVSGTWIASISPKARKNVRTAMPSMGAKANRIWMERMSVLAREMMSPEPLRS